jgi:inhibitor of cysteine peptidase
MMNRYNSNYFRLNVKLSVDKVTGNLNTKWLQTGAILFFALMLGHVDNTLAGQAMKLNENDSGKTVEIGVGDELDVMLPGNPTTGYGWELIPLDLNVLSRVKTAFFTNNNMMGAGGVEVITLHAVAAGKSEVKLIYHRSFEHDVEPLKTFELTVIIKKSSTE